MANRADAADLTEHAAFLRRLARGLVGDEHRALDLVQDTLVAGLEHPPRQSGNLRAWLARVLVNRARTLHRAEDRRRERERAALDPAGERPGDGGQVAEADERLALQAAIVRALGELGEAYRTVLVLRYYEGLGPAAIAERLGAPPETVKARLRRGLAQLRERLDRAHGGDRASWTVLCLPLARSESAAASATAAPWILGGVMTTTTVKVAAGTLLVSALALGFGPWLRERPDPGEIDSAEGAPRTVPIPAAPAVAQPAASRSAVAPAPEPATPAAAAPAPPPADEILGLRTGGPPQASPAILVFDARDRSPIEVFQLATETADDGYPRDAGTFRAPGGRLTRGGQPRVFWLDTADVFRITVWAEGYGPRVVDVSGFHGGRTVEVPLVPGAAPAVRGSVVRAGLPVADAIVSLSPFYDLQWEPAELKSATARRTGPDGRFALSAPAGSWILRVESDGADWTRQIELPAHTELVLDLDDLAQLAIDVRGPAHEPATGQVVILRTEPSDGRQLWQACDAEGQVRFENLEPGAWRATLHGTRERWHNQPTATLDLVLGRGERRAAALAAPPEGRHGRLVIEGGGDPSAWRAKGLYGEEWTPIGADGRLTLDLAEHTWIDLQTPAGTIWRWTVPAWSPGEDVVLIRAPGSAPTYRGRLRDRRTGEPLAGAAVKLQFGSGDEQAALVSVRAPTDAEGRFALPVPEDRVWPLSFQIEGRTVGSDSFTPAEPPSRAGELDVRIFVHDTHRSAQGLATAVVTGTVTDGPTGEPLRAGYVRVTAHLTDLDGTLVVSWSRANARTAADGTFRVELVAADRYAIRVWDEWTQDARTLVEERGALAAGALEVWDVTLP